MGAFAEASACRPLAQDGKSGAYLLVALPDAPVVPEVVELLDASLDGEAEDEDDGEVALPPADEPIPELAPLLAPPLSAPLRAGVSAPDAEAPVLPDVPLLLEALPPPSPELE